MRVLFDIVHPADVLFFKRPIEALIGRGDKVLILSRRKDVACDLLDSFGLPHTPVTTAGAGVLGLAKELITRDIAVFRQARRFRPDVMIGFGGVAISHAGALLRTRSISFYDSENASLQTRLTWPFISALYVPQSYAGPTPEGRTTKLKGVKDLSYLHPSAFHPDKALALSAGLDPNRANYFVRLVSWRANHDLGKGGWTEALLDDRSKCGYIDFDRKRNLNEEQGEDRRKLQAFNVYDFVPSSTGFYQYDGGLTEPPCSEVVWWNLADAPLYISIKQFNELINLTLGYVDLDTCLNGSIASPSGSTSRPVQPLKCR